MVEEKQAGPESEETTTPSAQESPEQVGGETHGTSSSPEEPSEPPAKVVEGTELTGTPGEEDQVLDERGINEILQQIERSEDSSASEPHAHSFPEAEAQQVSSSEPGEEDLLLHQVQLLRDVHVKVRVELGRGSMFLRDILRLKEGSVVELEKLAGDPLDIYVNDRLVAKGEVLVLNENFCIRVTEIFSPREVLRQRS